MRHCPASPFRTLRHLGARFAGGRQASAAVEFALGGLALFAFLMGIVNLGYLGLTLGALQHAVEQTARKAAVTAAANPSACPTSANIQTIFNGFASPVLPLNGPTLSYSSYSSSTATISPDTATDPWVDNTSSQAPPGTYLALTAAYNWKPIGFAEFSGIKLSITTVAFAMGSPQC